MDPALYIRYASGSMRINIGEFFSTQDLRKVRKVLRFASQHCSLEQREDLLSEMRRASQIRKDVADRVRTLELEKRDLLAPFFRNRLVYKASAEESQLLEQYRRILKSIIILKEVWKV